MEVELAHSNFAESIPSLGVSNLGNRRCKQGGTKQSVVQPLVEWLKVFDDLVCHTVAFLAPPKISTLTPAQLLFIFTATKSELALHSCLRNSSFLQGFRLLLFFLGWFYFFVECTEHEEKNQDCFRK